jgi:hypothetical protein
LSCLEENGAPCKSLKQVESKQGVLLLVVDRDVLGDKVEQDVLHSGDVEECAGNYEIYGSNTEEERANSQVEVTSAPSKESGEERALVVQSIRVSTSCLDTDTIGNSYAWVHPS